MARQVVVLAFLLLAAVQAFAIATAASTPAPTTSYNSDDDLTEPPTDGVIGVLEAADSPDSVVAAPMGGPVPPGAFDSTLGGSSDASTIRFSAVAGAAALAAGAIYF